MAQRIALSVYSTLDTPARLLQAHDHFEQQGVTPELAYINVRVSVDERRIERGVAELLDACSEGGVRFVQLDLSPPNEGAAAFYRAFVLEAMRREATLGTGPIFERCFSLALEAMAAATRGRLLGEVVGTSLEISSQKITPESRNARSCTNCVYEPLCSADLLGSLVNRAEPASRAPNTDWCSHALIALDLVFERAFSDAASVRAFLDQLGAVRNRVASRLSGKSSVA